MIYEYIKRHMWRKNLCNTKRELLLFALLHVLFTPVVVFSSPLLSYFFHVCLKLVGAEGVIFIDNTKKWWAAVRCNKWTGLERWNWRVFAAAATDNDRCRGSVSTASVWCPNSFHLNDQANNSNDIQIKFCAYQYYGTHLIMENVCCRMKNKAW